MNCFWLCESWIGQVVTYLLSRFSESGGDGGGIKSIVHSFSPTHTHTHSTHTYKHPLTHTHAHKHHKSGEVTSEKNVKRLSNPALRIFSHFSLVTVFFCAYFLTLLTLHIYGLSVIAFHTRRTRL